MFVPFGKFAPDLQDLGNPGRLTAMKNAVPSANGFQPFRALTSFSDALPARCYGAIAVRDSSSNLFVFAGTGAHLYRLLGSGWSQLSSGIYATPTDGQWEWTLWNNQTLIATNGVDAIQKLTLGGTQFSDLGGSPPVAKHIASVREFIVVGDTSSAANEVRWSGFNDAENWSIDPATQADLQQLRGGAGWVQRIVGGEYGVVFCERGVYRMTYVGSPVVWQFDEVLPDIGTPASGSVVQLGDVIFFLGQDGFSRLENGAKRTRIGVNRVDRFFWADANQSKLPYMRSAIDKLNSRVHWLYCSVNNSTTIPDRQLVYDWSNDNWGYAEYSAEELLNAAVGGVTLEQLDAYGTMETLSESLDSRVWGGDQLSEFGGFSSAHRLGFWTGSALDATFETGEAQVVPGFRATVTSVRPVVDGGTSTVALGTRDSQEQTHSYSGDVSRNRAGECPFRSNARYHRARVSVTGEYNDALGVDVQAVKAGAL